MEYGPVVVTDLATVSADESGTVTEAWLESMPPADAIALLVTTPAATSAGVTT